MKEENQSIIKALNKYDRVPEQWELLNEIYEAYKETNKNMTDIKECCKGNRKQAGNFKWEYVNINNMKGE